MNDKSSEADRQERLLRRLGYTFANPELFQRALTHRSAGKEHMERLEFLGDAVLGLVISEHLFARFPDRSEGQLSRMRAAMVRKESLLKIARTLKLSTLLIVGEGERSNGGIKSPSIAANAVEALIGAIFEDGGWEPARRVVLKAWQAMLKGIDEQDTCDAKSRLQEYTQAKGWGLPEYELIDHGTDYLPRFEAACRVNGELLGTGQGARKKLAELRAAQQAWEGLNS